MPANNANVTTAASANEAKRMLRLAVMVGSLRAVKVDVDDWTLGAGDGPSQPDETNCCRAVMNRK